MAFTGEATADVILHPLGLLLLPASSMPLTAVTLAFNGRQRQVALQCVKRASKVTYCQPTLALTCQATLSYDMLDKLTYPLGAKIRQKCQH